MYINVHCIPFLSFPCCSGLLWYNIIIVLASIIRLSHTQHIDMAAENSTVVYLPELS